MAWKLVNEDYVCDSTSCKRLCYRANIYKKVNNSRIINFNWYCGKCAEKWIKKHKKNLDIYYNEEVPIVH